MIEACDSAIIRGAELLRNGKLVVFPTETVYGLGANALDGQAVAGIFEAKGRPQFNPLIVHVSQAKEAEEYVEFSEMAKVAAMHFWPGPLTMILPRKKGCRVSELCSAGLSTLAVRVPAHDIAQKFLKETGVPVAAPSANRSGSISPTLPILAAESLGESVDLILAGGPCTVGLESTVLDLSGKQPVVLRPGAITAEQIEEVLCVPVGYDFGEKIDKPKSPGQLLRHYAPSIPVRLKAVDVEAGEALLAFGSTQFMAMKGGGFAHNLPETAFKNLSEQGDLIEAASNLFAYLHLLDCPEHKAIAVMDIPEQGLGIAMNDRLRRAAKGAGSQKNGLK